MEGIRRDVPVQHRFQGVRAENSRGIFASAGTLYDGALFGRDSIEAAEDLVATDHEIPAEVILTLASLQGLSYDELSEEEPGKIHHEHRTRADAKQDHSVSIFETLSAQWGGTDQEFTYYGSVDATPLYVRLICEYCAQYGTSILDEVIVARDGSPQTIRESLMKAYNWTTGRLTTSSSGLIEYRRTNPLGIENQVWKDSPTAYMTEDGTHLPFENGIAALEVQGYAYDALKFAQPLLGIDDNSKLLDELRHRVISTFWIEEQQIFSAAVTRNDAGGLQRLSVPLSNMGLILDSDILRDEQKNGQFMARCVARRVFDQDFWTTAGIRCRSLNYQHIVEFPDYHGSYAVWPKETSDIARGCEKHGLNDYADTLRQTILETITRLGEFYEYLFVDSAGEIVDPRNPSEAFADPRCNRPEPGQSWTISAFVSALHAESKKNRAPD